MSDAFDPNRIKIVSITPEVPRDASGRPSDWAKVIFQIPNGGPEFPVYVLRTHVTDENIIRVARHYLHMQTRQIADSTASWRLSDDDYKKIAEPQQKSPSIPTRQIPA
jgi:hypothetical protein